MKKQNSHIDNETYLAKWLEGEISDKDLQQFISDEDFVEYKKLRNGILVYKHLEAPLGSSFKSIRQKIEANKIKKVRNTAIAWTMAIAASLVLFFGLNIFLSDKTTEFSTSYSQQETIELLDGSEVVINSKSSIHYNANDWNTNREVVLDGEAFFKVKKGSTFTVRTKNGSVQVLGTQFNVNSNLDYFEVTCFEGKVKVINDNNNYILNPTNTFRKINGNPIENLHNSSTVPTWVSGESTFKSVPLMYVILAIEKEYHIEFDVTEIDKYELFTGSFAHDNLEVALASVFKTMKINYTKNDNLSIVLSK